MKRDDTLWKAILENVFDDFLRFLFKNADKVLDIDKGFQFLDKELEELFLTEESEAPKFVDKLAKVFTKAGKEEWVLVHVEVQGYDDKGFAKRMFTYFYRILDKYQKQVTAIAIFTDDNKKFYPTSYEYDFLGTRNSFHFNTYKIIEQDEKLLEQDDNPFAVVILTVLLALKRKALDDDLLKLKMQIFRNLYRRNVSEKKMRGLQTFLNLYVRFAKPETNAKFEEGIKLLTNNNATMGIEEFVLERAKKEGKAEGKAEDVKNLIEKLGLTDVQVSEILEVPIAFVEKTRQAINK
jgi:predicted transposase/invertase (TIGR01784 family)